MEKNSRKSKQRNKFRKNNNRFKKLKLKREKKEKSCPVLQKPNKEAEVYNNNKNVNERKKNKAQKLS